MLAIECPNWQAILTRLLLLLEPCFGNGQERGAFDTGLLAMRANRLPITSPAFFNLGQDIAPDLLGPLGQIVNNISRPISYS
jgi:hypothetical protein